MTIPQSIPTTNADGSSWWDEQGDIDHIDYSEFAQLLAISLLCRLGPLVPGLTLDSLSVRLEPTGLYYRLPEFGDCRLSQSEIRSEIIVKRLALPEAANSIADALVRNFVGWLNCV